MTTPHPPPPPSPLWTAAVALLYDDAPAQITGTPQNWPRWQELLPHVLAVTTHPDRADPSTAAGQDHHVVGAEVAWLLDRAATYLQVRGQPAAAQPLAERALAITEAALDPDHPDLALRLGTLAVILKDLGKAEQARPLAERALAITEAALGPDHPTVAIRLVTLATILADLGQITAARPLAERALTIHEVARGPDHPTTLWTRGVHDELTAAEDEEVCS